MQKKLTISIDEQIYSALYRVVGQRKISRFIEDLVRGKVMDQDLGLSYKEMSENEIRESDAREWSEGTLEEFTDEAW